MFFVPDPDFVSRWSSWPKLIRVTAYILRFISRCRRIRTDAGESDKSGRTLTAAECRSSHQLWIKLIQSELFRAEIHALSNRKPLSTRSSILSLRPFLDSDGVLRVGGRLRNAPISATTRQPILLASYPLVHLIIDHAHKRALHAGVQLTTNNLRQDFWIIHARSLVRLVINRCVACAWERAAVPPQLMEDLPAVRVTAPERCFLRCGLDYAGLVLVRASTGRRMTTRKAYIALFICIVTRLIHLELDIDYSTASFLNAFSRFCARYSLLQSVYSDNGTTFVGADRELSTAFCFALRDRNFQNKTAIDNVTWLFLPPSAPHFCGIWEAGVKSVKHHLRRMLGRYTFAYEELETLLCRI